MGTTEVTEVKIGRALSMRRWDRDGVTLVLLSGDIDDSMDVESLISELGDSVVFDFCEVLQVNSHGVRQWTNAMSRLGANYYGFLRCTPAIIAQFNMVSGFGGRGEILSLYLPYICPDCDDETQLLVEPWRESGILRGDELPMVECSKCVCEKVFDDLPEVYFSYLSSMLPPSPPPRTRAFLEEQPWRTP